MPEPEPELDNRILFSLIILGQFHEIKLPSGPSLHILYKLEFRAVLSNMVMHFIADLYLSFTTHSVLS